jgi:DNA polymerase V
MGVKMGDPYFKIRNMLAFNGVVVRSMNMSLYREISAEVMSRIRLYTDAAEIYSIDESFFNMAISNIKDPLSYCRTIRKDIWEKCRIPVSVGIAPTKTLCKMATEYAKKNEERAASSGWTGRNTRICPSCRNSNAATYGE